MSEAKFTLRTDTADSAAKLHQMVRLAEELGIKFAGVSDKVKKIPKDPFKDATQDAKRLVEQIMGIGLSAAGAMALITKMFNAWKEGAEAAATRSKELHGQMVDLMFVGDNAKDPKIKERMQATAAQWGIPVGEVAKSRYLLESSTAGLEAKQREALFKEMLQFRQTTAMGMEATAPLFIDPANLFKREKLSPNEIQNVIKKTMDLSKGSPEQMAGQFPKILGAGQLGGMSFRETASMFSAATLLTGTTEQAATAMENMILRAMFTDLPDEEKDKANALAWARHHRGVKKEEEKPLEDMLKKAGIRPEDNFLTRMRKLNELRKRGGVGDQTLAELFNIRGLRGALPLLRDEMRTFEQFNKEMAATTGPGVDLVGNAIAVRMRTDPEFGAHIRNLQLTEELDAQKQRGALDAVRDENFLLEMGVNMRKAAGGKLTPQDYIRLKTLEAAHWAERFAYSASGGRIGAAPGESTTSILGVSAASLGQAARAAELSNADVSSKLDAAADKMLEAGHMMSGGRDGDGGGIQMRNIGAAPPVVLQN